MGESFTVQGTTERVEALQAAASLRQAGAINFRVTTRAVGRGQFAVIALRPGSTETTNRRTET